MSRFIYIIVCTLLLSSCKKQDLGIVYFFEQEDFTITVPIECSKMEKYNGLREVQLSERLNDLFTNLLKNKNSDEVDYIPDVRYKVVIDSNTVCFDYSGNFITNNGKTGKILFMEEIKKYIDDNFTKSIIITEPTPKPWKNNN